MTETQHKTPQQEVLTTEEAAVLVRLSQQKLLEWVREGKISGIPLGNQWLFVREQLLDEFKAIAKRHQAQRAALAVEAKTDQNPRQPRQRGRPANTTLDLSGYDH